MTSPAPSHALSEPLRLSAGFFACLGWSERRFEGVRAAGCEEFTKHDCSNDTIREIAKALRRHVDAATLEKVVNELLDVPGNRDFRNAIEELPRELMRR